MGDELHDNPAGQYGQSTRPLFWDRLSQAISDIVVEGPSNIVSSPRACHIYIYICCTDTPDIKVTVALRAPNVVLAGPSEPYTDGGIVQRSNWSEIEYPTFQAPGLTVMAFHPMEPGNAGRETYEIWPNGAGHTWQARWVAGNPFTTEVNCPIGSTDAVLVQCETGEDTDQFTTACPNEPGELEMPIAGGGCNFTVVTLANPAVDNTFTVDYTLTTVGVALLMSCFSKDLCG